MADAGCSGTPLARKLGLRAGARLHLIDAPPELMQWLAPLPRGLQLAPRIDATVDVVHAFVTERARLAALLGPLRAGLRADARLWISWPKKAAKVDTDVTEDVIRELALPLGFVDVKVCAVSAVWSGLALVVRKALR